MEVCASWVANVPNWVSITIGAFVWLLSCVVALNIAFGKDSLFMFKQLQYAVGEKLAPPLFWTGFLLWPISVPGVYVFLYIYVMAEGDKEALFRGFIKVGLWVMCTIIGFAGATLLYAGLFK